MDCTPEVRSVGLSPGDNAIVLATDGLWDVLSDVAVVGVLGRVRTRCIRWRTFRHVLRLPPLPNAARDRVWCLCCSM